MIQPIQVAKIFGPGRLRAARRRGTASESPTNREANIGQILSGALAGSNLFHSCHHTAMYQRRLHRLHL